MFSLLSLTVREKREKHLVVPASLQSDRRRIPRVPDARGKLLFSLSPSFFLSSSSHSQLPLEILSDHLSLPDFISRFVD